MTTKEQAQAALEWFNETYGQLSSRVASNSDVRRYKALTTIIAALEAVCEDGYPDFVIEWAKHKIKKAQQSGLPVTSFNDYPIWAAITQPPEGQSDE